MHIALSARVSTADKHPQAGIRRRNSSPCVTTWLAMPNAPTASAFVDHAGWEVSRSLGSAAK